jgi:methyl-accepting chemotaxis protein
VPTVAGARDEIAMMAATLNTLADHKSTFVHWWSTAMREAVALRDLHAAAGTDGHADAVAELGGALDARRERVLEACDRMHRHADALGRVAEHLRGCALSDQDAASVRAAAADLAVLSQVLAADKQGRAPSVLPPAHRDMPEGAAV